MKKIIVAAAGLMLVGAMASTAMAEFKFSGDARARFYYEKDYDFSDADGEALEIGNYTASDSDTHWNSRVRFKVDADTKGGAYAHTRFNLADGTFGEGNGGEIHTDYAYIGVPFGPVAVEAGKWTRDITNFFYWDQDADGVMLKYKAEMTSLVGFYDITDEDTLDASDDDNTMYGVILNQSFGGGWDMIFGAVYIDDETIEPSKDGFAATVEVSGDVGAVGLAAALAYQEEDSGLTYATNEDGTKDDGFGGYLSASTPIGPVALTGVVGFTQDGYNIDDEDYGPFIMFNDVSQISTDINFDEIGDTVFVAITPSFKASEKLTLGANFAYAAIDNFGDDGGDFDMYEIGATAAYAVTDGAVLKGVVGYLDVDDALQDNPFGAGMSLEVSF